MKSNTQRRRRLLAEVQKISSISILAFMGSQFAYAQQQPPAVVPDTTEEIVITGVRASMKAALDVKKNAAQIVDAISAEDVGKLPDLNVAEAMQRVTGVQINRGEDGAGGGFQIRGSSQNRVEVNGVSLAGNSSDGNRSNAFNSTSSALFSGIEIFKSPTADMVEGAIGGTVRLKTFKPLDFKERKIVLNLRGQQNDNDEDLSKSGSLLLGDNWETSAGMFGALVNLSYEDKSTLTHQWETNYRARNKDGGQAQAVLDSAGALIVPPQALSAQNKNIILPEYVSKGTIIRADGTVQTDHIWPDNTFAKTPTSLAAPVGATVFMPQEIWFLNKQFAQEKYGVDTSFQWAPTDELTLDAGVLYSHSDQVRPETRLILPNSNYYANGWLMQEYARSPYGDELDKFGKPIASDTSIKTYVLKQATTYRDGVRFVNNLDIQEEDQLSYSFGGKLVGDMVAMELRAAHTESDIIVKGLRMPNSIATKPSGQEAYAGRQYAALGADSPTSLTPNLPFANAQQPNSFFDFTDKSYDLPVSGLYNYDFAKKVSGDINLLDPMARKWVNFNGENTDTHQAEDSIAFDVDINVNKFGITTFETGIRATNAKYERKKEELRRFDLSLEKAGLLAVPVVNNTPALPNTNFTTDTAFGDRSNNGIYTDGYTTFYEMEKIEPGFIKKGLTTIDNFFGDLKVNPYFPQSWVAPANTDQVNKEWFRRLALTSGTFWYSPSQFYDIDEATQAIYVKANFEYDIGVPVTGNIGVRYVHTRDSIHGNEYRKANDLIFNQLTGQRLQLGQTIYKEGLLPDVTEAQNKAPAPNPGTLAYEQPRSSTTEVRVNVATPVFREKVYNDVLPSLNVSFQLTDNMFVRVAASKVMSRPNPSDLRANTSTEDIPELAGGNFLGNPNLDPYRANTFDLSYEWYINKTAAISIAFFKKDIKEFIKQDRRSNVEVNTACETKADPAANKFEVPGKACFNKDNQLPADPTQPDDLTNDIYLYKVNTFTQPINGGEGSVNGYEISLRGGLDSWFDNWVSGFGMETNYTYTDSSQKTGFNDLTGENLPIKDQSEDSVNLILFYEKYGFSIRAAYNYRSASWKGEGEQSIPTPYYAAAPVQGAPLEYYTSRLATFEKAQGILDLSINYDITSQYSVFAQAQNLNDSHYEQYSGMEDIPRMYRDVGVTYSLGFRGKF